MIEALLIGAGVSTVAGLDRTALMQLMVSRPIVAAPLTGFLLGAPEIGLSIGALLELLWIGRLPMGAAIPPDDTQIAVASTVLAATTAAGAIGSSQVSVLLSLLVAIPLGKVGVALDQWARRRNTLLSHRAAAALDQKDIGALERIHLCGLTHFGAASLTTFLFIALSGWGLVTLLAPFLETPLSAMSPWLYLVFPGVGVAHLLANLNVNRILTLFVSSFLMTYMLLWLL